MENPLCTTKQIVWRRPDLFHVPTQNEIRQGVTGVTEVNIRDPVQTGLPQFDRSHLHVVTLGPYQVDLARGYITGIQVIK